MSLIADVMTGGVLIEKILAVRNRLMPPLDVEASLGHHMSLDGVIEGRLRLAPRGSHEGPITIERIQITAELLDERGRVLSAQDLAPIFSDPPRRPTVGLSENKRRADASLETPVRIQPGEAVTLPVKLYYSGLTRSLVPEMLHLPVISGTRVMADLYRRLHRNPRMRLRVSISGVSADRGSFHINSRPIPTGLHSRGLNLKQDREAGVPVIYHLRQWVQSLADVPATPRDTILPTRAREFIPYAKLLERHEKICEQHRPQGELEIMANELRDHVAQYALAACRAVRDDAVTIDGLQHEPGHYPGTRHIRITRGAYRVDIDARMSLRGDDEGRGIKVVAVTITDRRTPNLPLVRLIDGWPESSFIGPAMPMQLRQELKRLADDLQPVIAEEPIVMQLNQPSAA